MTLYQGKYRVESSRFRGWDYRARGWYFVTICTRDRRHLFGEIIESEMRLSSIGKVAESELQSLSRHYGNIEMIEFVVMPNHIHALIAIEADHQFSPHSRPNLWEEGASQSPEAGSLSTIVRGYKAGVTRCCHDLGFRGAIWQERFHDHILRGDAVIAAVREYIRNNPVNWSQDKENTLRA